MKYLKQYGNDRTKYPAVIGYNRLLSDDEPTHKFLRDVGIGQSETNYEQIIRFTQRFLRDLHHVDKDAYRTLFDMVNGSDNHKTQKEEKFIELVQKYKNYMENIETQRFERDILKHDRALPYPES